LSILQINPKNYSGYYYFVEKRLPRMAVMLIFLAISPALAVGQSLPHAHSELFRSDEITFEMTL